MQALLQTAQEVLQNIQAFLETPRTNVTVLQDAGNAGAPHADVAASKRRDGGLGSARRSGRGIYAAVESSMRVERKQRRKHLEKRMQAGLGSQGSDHHTYSLIAQTGTNK
jgi:hypothetical protein